MKKNTFLYILRLSLTLLTITAVMAVALAGVNKLTAGKIADITKEKTDTAIANVLPNVRYIEDVTEGFKSSRSLEVPELIRKIYFGFNKPQTCLIEPGMTRGFAGCAIEVGPSGFDGEISLMVGISNEGKVTGISIISHTETAGLGAVAAAENDKGQVFRDQFVGMSGHLAITKDGGDVDAITGATVTSRAITEGVNQALEFYEYLHERGIF